MKVESIVINVLVAIVALFAGHVFWPASSVGGKPISESAVSSNNPASAPATGVSTPSSPFTPELRDKLAKAREAALASDPTLKTEEEGLIKQRGVLMKENLPASATEREALLQKWKDHSEKMKADMIKADPSLQ